MDKRRGRRVYRPPGPTHRPIRTRGLSDLTDAAAKQWGTAEPFTKTEQTDLLDMTAGWRSLGPVVDAVASFDRKATPGELVAEARRQMTERKTT